MLKTRRKEIGVPGGLALGLLAGLIITFSGAALMAFLIAGGTAGESSAEIAASVIQLLSAAIGALTAVGCIRKMRLQICLLTGLTYYLVLLGITALFFEGSYDGMLISALMVLIGSAGVAFVPSKKAGTGKKRRKGYR